MKSGKIGLWKMGSDILLHKMSVTFLKCNIKSLKKWQMRHTLKRLETYDFGKFKCKQMQNICEIAWVNNKTLGYENWLPQHAQNIIAVKNFCSKMKNFYILTQKWNKLMKITLSAQFYEKGFTYIDTTRVHFT